MSRFRLMLPLLLLFGLSACAKSVWAPDEAITKWSYVHGGTPTVTLITVINNNSGEGGHSALLINARERVVFDPAGNWKSKYAPERNDFVYGMRPEILERYLSFHARKAWHVVMQTKEVTPEVAEIFYQLSKNNGAVPSGFCSNSVSKILRAVPGFESVKVSLSPKKTMQSFASLAGVTTETLFEYD